MDRNEPKRTKKNQKEQKRDDYPNKLANLDNFETVLDYPN